jgi:hypothetical protein
MMPWQEPSKVIYAVRSVPRLSILPSGVDAGETPASLARRGARSDRKALIVVQGDNLPAGRFVTRARLEIVALAAVLVGATGQVWLGSELILALDRARVIDVSRL